eukprot:6961061-Pyramimonas_sp.AAC.1
MSNCSQKLVSIIPNKSVEADSKDLCPGGFSGPQDHGKGEHSRTQPIGLVVGKAFQDFLTCTF